MDTTEARRLCYESGGEWMNGECLTKEQAQLRRDEAACRVNGGLFIDGVCHPSINALDSTDSTEGLSPGQFAITWGALPAGTKYVAVEYTPEGKETRVYGGGKIKATYTPPLKVAGQKPGTKVTCTVRALNEWGKQIGYSNEVELTTK